MYGKLLPDYGDLDNASKTAPGYRVYVLENDGGISLQMIHADENPAKSRGYSVFMNIEETKELINGLQDAVERAIPKNVNHPALGKNC